MTSSSLSTEPLDLDTSDTSDTSNTSNTGEVPLPDNDSNYLLFTMQMQPQTNWCWSAVGTSVGLFFAPAALWTQCGVVCGVLPNTTCCTTPGATDCNVTGYLDKSLTYTNSYASKVAEKCSMETIMSNIDAGLPIGLRCAWGTSGTEGAHFLAITGYDADAGLIEIGDSIYGPSSQDYATFPSAYQGGGQWTHTYFTSNNA